ncbi:Transcriptional regulatory protein SrrA [Geobacillus sp. BCO2]|nr:Transcriptional regulatory protein SrrA [Geobacillus sp. BCO2]
MSESGHFRWGLRESGGGFALGWQMADMMKQGEEERLKQILIVEDEEVLRMLAVDLLTDEGYEVDEAADGAEALARLRERDYDLIVLDYMLPFYSGLEVLESIDCHCPERRPKVIMLSAKTGPADQGRAWAAGVDWFIEKPYRPTEFVKKVNEILHETDGHELSS